MLRRRSQWICIACVFLACGCTEKTIEQPVDSMASSSSKVTHVDVSSIGQEVILNGKCGRALGVPFSVTGKWAIHYRDLSKPREVDNDYKSDSWPVFIVESVDGKKLPNMIEFREGCVVWSGYSTLKPSREDGVEWKCRAYETMGFTSVPQSIRNEIITIADWEDFHAESYLMIYRMDDGASIGQAEP